eukprot:TRINITY_DN9327_c1_g1_i2.p1 TRINITY_DN9327_c1_g1~~TRINITY_DN9327_c1_g1_i2.p1  ORF type:complete len:356 (-),score=73.81 TRINITY_DN9327_c1_g1_i2:494-1561(-)
MARSLLEKLCTIIVSALCGALIFWFANNSLYQTQYLRVDESEHGPIVVAKPFTLHPLVKGPNPTVKDVSDHILSSQTKRPLHLFSQRPFHNNARAHENGVSLLEKQKRLDVNAVVKDQDIKNGLVISQLSRKEQNMTTKAKESKNDHRPVREKTNKKKSSRKSNKKKHKKSDREKDLQIKEHSLRVQGKKDNSTLDIRSLNEKDRESIKSIIEKAKMASSNHTLHKEEKIKMKMKMKRGRNRQKESIAKRKPSTLPLKSFKTQFPKNQSWKACPSVALEGEWSYRQKFSRFTHSPKSFAPYPDLGSSDMLDLLKSMSNKTIYFYGDSTLRQMVSFKPVHAESKKESTAHFRAHAA